MTANRSIAYPCALLLTLALAGCGDGLRPAAAPAPATASLPAVAQLPPSTPAPSPTQAPSPTPNDVLTISRAGTGSGTVVSSPVGIDCGTTCTADYAQNTLVTLTATAAAGSSFTGFSGDCTGSSCTVTMSAAHAVTATFATVPPAAQVGIWLGGDMHVHTDHSSDGSFPRQTISQDAPGNNAVSDQIGEAERESVQWMSITDHRTYDQHYDPLWESSTLLLVPGEEANGSPHCTIHGAVDMIDQADAPAGSPAFRSVQQSIWSAHTQDATFTVAHPDDGELNDDGTPNNNANAVGMDSIENWNRASNIEAEITYAESRWNLGFRFGINGGSDDHFKELWGLSSPGTPRTFVFAGDTSERSILQAQRDGHFSVHLRSTDPFVTLEGDFQNDGVYEAIGGDEVVVPAGTKGTLRIHVTNAPLMTVNLYQSPGKSAPVLFTATPTSLDQTYTVPITATASPTWYRVEVRGTGEPAYVDLTTLKSGNVQAILAQQSQVLGNQLKAIASPIFVSPTPVTAHGDVPVPDDAGVDDGAMLALGDAQQFTGFPAVAESAFGTHLVAETHPRGATQVLYARRAADGSLSTPIVLSGSSKTARFPKIAASGANVWVVWEDERSGQIPHRKSIYLRQSIDGGNSWLPEMLIRSVAGRAEHPVVAALPSGQPVVAWQEIQSGLPFDIWAQVIGTDAAPVNLSGTGKTYGAATPLDTRSAKYPASVWPTLAVSTDGRIALAWQDDRTDPDPLFTGIAGAGDGTAPDNWQIQVATRTAAGWNPAVSIGTDDHADRHPALAFAASGVLAVAWDSKPLSASGPNLVVDTALSSDGGATFSAPALAGGMATAFGQRPALGRDSDGLVHLAWFDNRSADWRWRIVTSKLGADGGWSAGTLINSLGINSWPALDGATLVFASTRNALRLQRDRTQQIMVLPMPK